MLSGFVLTTRYSAAFRNRQSHTWRRYAVARCARIAPVYFAVLAVTVVAYLLTADAVSLAGSSATRSEWMVSLALNAVPLQAWVPDDLIQQYWNAPSWSIGVELLFYLLMPWAWSRCRLPTSWAFMAGIVAAHALIQFGGRALFAPVLDEKLVEGYAARMPLMSSMYFLIGMVLAERRRVLSPQQRCANAWLPLAALVVSASLSSTWSGNAIADIAVQQIVWFMLFAWLIEALANERPASGWTAWPRTLLGTRPVVLLGKASYSLYLIHWLPLGFALNLLPPTVRGGAAAWLFVALVVLASVAVYRLLEEPARRAINATAGTRRGSSGCR